MLWNSFLTGSCSSSVSWPASACRNSSIMTGTFMVLAAWNAVSGDSAAAAAPSRRAYTTATSGAAVGAVWNSPDGGPAMIARMRATSEPASWPARTSASRNHGMPRVYPSEMPSRELSGKSVVVGGAGLAGLSAARALEARGAAVTVVEARNRVGGRVWTMRESFAGGQHAEAGADLIEDEQEHVFTLARELGLKPQRILRESFGFYGPDARGRR